MELSFKDRDIRDICLSSLEAEQKLGARVAKCLIRRLADLSAVASVEEFFQFPGNPRLDQESQFQVVVDLSDEWLLLFGNGHVKRRLKSNGEIDWARVTRVKILGLERRYE